MLVKQLLTAPEPLYPANLNGPRASTTTNTLKPLADVSEAENRCPRSPMLDVPTVRLDSDLVSSEMTARLAMSLLGHVLFLKSQIPL